jgi:hypothetical protein
VSDERTVTDWDTTEAMIVYGGAFVGGLGMLWRVADPTNRIKLEVAFLFHFEKYRELAEQRREALKAIRK